MKCGVKFCGGCNPSYDRGETLKEIREQCKDMDFVHVTEGGPYDLLLVIGGCSSCCASFEEIETKNGVLKIWEQTQVKTILDAIEEKKQVMKQGR